ncbi:DUF397 domain-containing protein [Streptomyces hyaluromycini]|uniref:DUF397 domain-containing protein n=1 Tax=Streptomyces hyaluromycini TaxID=1377993 RepID=UPI00123829EE|nr:DUF397 domain-containing protein [Streptomyces hyaluromycini]
MSTPSMDAPHVVTTAQHDVDLTHARWRKSSYSGGANDCVEVAELGECAAVRDSKDISRGPLLFSTAAMRALVSGIANGSIIDR